MTSSCSYISNACIPPSSFGQITNKKCNNNTELCKNIEKYVKSLVECKVIQESKYWDTTAYNLSISDFDFNSGPDYFFKYLPTDYFIGGILKISDLTSPAIIIPPSYTDLFDKLSNKLGRPLRNGDTYKLSIVNSNTAHSVFLFTSHYHGAFSSLNSTYNGWLHRMILPGQTVTYWIRINTNTPPPNVATNLLPNPPNLDSYEIYRSFAIFNNVASIPNPAVTFPDDGSYTAIVNDVLTSLTPYPGPPCADNMPCPPGITGFDVVSPDPVTGVT